MRAWWQSKQRIPNSPKLLQCWRGGGETTFVTSQRAKTERRVFEHKHVKRRTCQRGKEETFLTPRYLSKGRRILRIYRSVESLRNQPHLFVLLVEEPEKVWKYTSAQKPKVETLPRGPQIPWCKPSSDGGGGSRRRSHPWCQTINTQSLQLCVDTSQLWRCRWDPARSNWALRVDLWVNCTVCTRELLKCGTYALVRCGCFRKCTRPQVWTPRGLAHQKDKT